MDRINKTLEELEDDEFKKFQRQLREAANLEGEEPLGRALLQNKDRMDTADAILQTYPDKVDQIMVNVLLKVGRKDLQKQYLSKVAAVSVPVLLAASPNGSAHKGTAASGPEVAWVNKHKRSLIQRVTMVDAILDVLVEEGVMKNEDYGAVRSERTNPGRMRELFLLLDARGSRAKRAFYKGLEEHDPCLMEDLNEQA